MYDPDLLTEPHCAPAGDRPYHSSWNKHIRLSTFSQTSLIVKGGLFYYHKPSKGTHCDILQWFKVKGDTRGMKKQIVSAVLTAAMTMSLMAGTAVSVNADEAGAKREGIKIGMTVPTVGNDFMVALSGMLEGYLTDQGYEVQFDSADGDVTKQQNQIENDIQMGCDALVVWPVNGEGVSNTVTQAVEQGIPVLAFANAIPGASANQVAAADSEMGAAQAELASDWIDATFPDAKDGEVKVFVITSSNTPQAVDRSEGMLTIADLNSKVNLITSDVDWDSPSASSSLVENTLMTDPDIKVIMTPGGVVGTMANNFVMSANANVEDKAHFAIFTVDETEEIDAAIVASANDEAVLRGTISMGTLEDTVADFAKAIQPYLDGGEMQQVDGTAFKVTADTLAGAAETEAE
ncbi:MAG TPA: hypothetical protein DEV97_01630 [Lachnospiraceae bacterium]|nr:hypothetical protein [Lachnospiraceae bacterium]